MIPKLRPQEIQILNQTSKVNSLSFNLYIESIEIEESI
jgi:hypothetical protein